MRSNPYQQENLRQGAFHYLMGRGAAGVAGFFTVILLVRFMDLPNYAAYTALSGIVALCGVLAGLGMERVVSRYIPEARLDRSIDELSLFIWITSAVKLLAALLSTALLYALWPVIEQFLIVTEFKVFSAALFFFIIAETMFQHFTSVLQSLVMQKTLTRLLVVQWVGRLLLIVLVISIKSGIDWQDSLWIFAIPELLGVIGFVIVIKRHLHGLRSERHELKSGHWPQWNNVAKVGLHNFGFTLLAAPPQGYFMKVLTAAFLPVEVVAAYGFFLSVSEKARQYIPLHFFYGLLEPMMIAGYLKDRNFSELSYRCQLLYKSNLLLMVPAIAWIAVAGDPILDLMTGGKFHGLSWILVLVMFQLTIGSHVVLLQLLLNSLEKSKILFVASVIALIGMLFAMAVSVRASPMWLLCSPILFSLIMNLYIVFCLARSDHAYKPSWKMLGSVSFAGLAAFVAVKTLVVAMPSSATSFVTAAFTLLGVITVYLMVIWLSKAIDQSEIELIKGIILSIRRTKRDAKSGGPEPIRSQTSARYISTADSMWGGRQLISQLQADARTILNPLIPHGSSVALLDYPNNPNVGDSLIWLGEITYLKSRNIKLEYTCDARNFNREKLAESLNEDSIILIHGGGNFGTLWPEEQQFRLRVLREFPGRQIIQFSQSIHFDDAFAVETTAQAIRAHGNYILLARDNASFEFASKHFECQTILCPDMAFFIGSIKSKHDPQFDRFILSRTDHEKSGNWLDELPLTNGPRIDVSDWLMANRYERFIGRIERHTVNLRRIFDPHNKALFYLWNYLAKQRLARGKSLLERGRVVISDRLHGHILAILLNKPHAVIDNSNRKISSLHQVWTMPYQGVTFAKDIHEALRAADDFDLSASMMSDAKATPLTIGPLHRKCVVVTCFAQNQPGYLDFSYRIKSLAKNYNLTILSQNPLTQSELMVPAAEYIAMGRQNGKYGWLSYVWKCASYVRKHKPDVLVLMHSSASPIALLVGKVPVCLYWNEHPTNLIHLPEVFSPLRHFLAVASQRLVFLGARQASLVMPIGEEHRDDLLANGCKPERVKLTYMGVADAFSAGTARHMADAKPLELIYIGTVSGPRGRDVMLEGAAQAIRSGHDVRLTIVGADDEQLAYCRQKVNQLGIDDCVRILGRVPGSDIPGLLSKADLGICLWEDKPWWRFNPPTKLFEYLAAGLPVLASDIRTHTRYVENWNNGVIFEYGAAGFAQKIGELVVGKDKLADMKRNAYRSGQTYLWSKIEPTFLDNVAGLVSA